MSSASTNSLDLRTVAHPQFAALVDSKFTLRYENDDGSASVAPLQLIEVKPLGAKRGMPGAPREPFSLLFRAATRQFYLPQKIYALEHTQLGACELFLVPLGPDATGMRFEAILA